MYQNLYQRYRRGCMMLFRKEGEEVTFLGTAFVIHPHGYLITAAHLLYSESNLVVAPWEFSDEFVPVATHTVVPVGVNVVHTDKERDLCLLRFAYDMEIAMPDHVIGLPDEIQVGGDVVCLGYPFGYYHIYCQMMRQAIVAAKVSSRNGTNCILFDAMVHDGMRGGPLVGAADGRVIGVVVDRFDPQEASPFDVSIQSSTQTSVSYAVSIEYAVQMMAEEGLEIV